MPSTSSDRAPAETTTPDSGTSDINRRVRVLPPHSWRGFVCWQTASQNREAVFDALLHDPETGRDAMTCVKLYQDQDGRSRGLVNEITGWLIAYALGLPQPEQAYLVKAPLAKLPRPLPLWLSSLKKAGTRHYWGFATAKMPAESAALRFSRADQPLLVDDICTWQHLPNAIALDEHIANTDRHLNNLLRLGKARYALIDNGRLAVEGAARNWQSAQLNTGRHYPNLLSDTCWADNPPARQAAATIHASRRHPDALAHVREELQDWWRRLIPDEAERAAFDHFICTRAASLSILLSKRYHQLPV